MTGTTRALNQVTRQQLEKRYTVNEDCLPIGSALLSWLAFKALADF
ncbi:hypothetical protein [Neomoorella thermoacetica]|nr:hypothetical protein [Moorella thermoacetica]